MHATALHDRGFRATTCLLLAMLVLLTMLTLSASPPTSARLGPVSSHTATHIVGGASALFWAGVGLLGVGVVLLTFATCGAADLVLAAVFSYATETTVAGVVSEAVAGASLGLTGAEVAKANAP